MTYETIQGTLTSVDVSYINPYSGETLNITGDYYVNDSVVIGGDVPGEIDYALGLSYDQIWNLEDSSGNPMFIGIDFFLPSSGDDILILSSSTILLT